jgi:hypothetical protein
VAEDLRRWSTNPPVEFRAVLALSFVLMGSRDFALAEFETVEASQLTNANARQIYHGGRGLLYAMQGWNRLATPEVEAYAHEAKLSENPVSGPQLLAVFHAYLAWQAFEQREFARMDAEIAQSLRVWPDNPVAVFLTGEKLAANGEWEQAADSLEAQVAGTENEWLARRFAQRARDLRDGKGSAKALVLDSRFLAEVTAHYAMKAAGNSAAGKKVGEAVDTAKTFGQGLLQKIPMLGSGTNAESAGQP